VQLDHRLLAWALAVLVPWFRWRARGAVGPLRVALDLLLALLALQVGLGIATLLWFVPVPLAAAHQAVALLVFGAVVWVNHELRVPRPA
jgi:cytochrome c oxidase assembly protein subunit 15